MTKITQYSIKNCDAGFMLRFELGPFAWDSSVLPTRLLLFISLYFDIQKNIFFKAHHRARPRRHNKMTSRNWSASSLQSNRIQIVIQPNRSRQLDQCYIIFGLSVFEIWMNFEEFYW